MNRLALSTLALALTLPTYAGELAGVSMPDTDTLAGQSLVLNGMALREKFFAKGTIPGAAFMKLIFGNYVGPNADKALRTGLLGS